jgi:hypothetical protein
LTSQENHIESRAQKGDAISQNKTEYETHISIIIGCMHQPVQPKSLS